MPISQISIEWRIAGGTLGSGGHISLVARTADQHDGDGYVISGNPLNYTTDLVEAARIAATGNYGYLQVNLGNGAGSALNETIDRYVDGERESDRHSVNIADALLAMNPGKALDQIWSEMVSCANQIDREQFIYDPAEGLQPDGPALNSNSLISSVLSLMRLDVRQYLTGDLPSFGFPGQDAFLSGANGDELKGFGDGVRMFGRGGDDRLLGSNGDDLIDGGKGNDFLLGLRGSDQVFGQDGNDTILGSANEDQTSLEGDVYDGGSGVDTLDYGAVTGFGVLGQLKGAETKITKFGEIPAENNTDVARNIEHLILTNNNDTLISTDTLKGPVAGVERTFDGGHGIDGINYSTWMLVRDDATHTVYDQTGTGRDVITNFEFFNKDSWWPLLGMSNNYTEFSNIAARYILPDTTRDVTLGSSYQLNPIINVPFPPFDPMNLFPQPQVTLPSTIDYSTVEGKIAFTFGFGPFGPLMQDSATFSNGVKHKFMPPERLVGSNNGDQITMSGGSWANFISGHGDDNVVINDLASLTYTYTGGSDTITYVNPSIISNYLIIKLAGGIESSDVVINIVNEHRDQNGNRISYDMDIWASGHKAIDINNIHGMSNPVIAIDRGTVLPSVFDPTQPPLIQKPVYQSTGTFGDDVRWSSIPSLCSRKGLNLAQRPIESFLFLNEKG